MNPSYVCSTRSFQNFLKVIKSPFFKKKETELLWVNIDGKKQKKGKKEGEETAVYERL